MKPAETLMRLDIVLNLGYLNNVIIKYTRIIIVLSIPGFTGYITVK